MDIAACRLVEDVVCVVASNSLGSAIPVESFTSNVHCLQFAYFTANNPCVNCMPVVAIQIALKQASMSKFLYGGRVDLDLVREFSNGFEQGCTVTVSPCAGLESFGDNVSMEIAARIPTASSDSDLQVLHPIIASLLIVEA